MSVLIKFAKWLKLDELTNHWKSDRIVRHRQKKRGLRFVLQNTVLSLNGYQLIIQVRKHTMYSDP